MTLYESCRGMPSLAFTRNWNRAIWKETCQRNFADSVEEADIEEFRTLGTGTLRPHSPARSTKSWREKRGWPANMPTAEGRATPPRGFQRHKGALKPVEHESIGRKNRRDVGAFSAQVTASAGSGFLPKPNQFVPGKEAALGPLPPKLVKGEYPASYVFAKGDPNMGVMVWANGESQKKLPKAARDFLNKSMSAPQLADEADEAKNMSATCPGGFGASSSSMAKSASQTGPAKKSDFFGRPRPPSGHKTQIAESRLEAHVNTHRPDQPFGSTSWFLASKEINPSEWSGDRNGKRADSGQVFYWGC